MLRNFGFKVRYIPSWREGVWFRIHHARTPLQHTRAAFVQINANLWLAAGSLYVAPQSLWTLARQGQGRQAPMLPMRMQMLHSAHSHFSSQAATAPRDAQRWVVRIKRNTSRTQKAVQRAKAIADAAMQTDVPQRWNDARTRSSATQRLRGTPVLQPADEMLNASHKEARKLRPKPELTNKVESAANLVSYTRLRLYHVRSLHTACSVVTRTRVSVCLMCCTCQAISRCLAVSCSDLQAATLLSARFGLLCRQRVP